MKTPAALSDHLLEKFSAMIESRLGLQFPPARWPELSRALHATAPELGFPDAEQCADWLLSNPMTREQMDLFITRLTVGETYFFRDPAAFDVLEKTALPELIRARRLTTKRLRIWSAGCCTGEEPYSIAISVVRALPDIAAWDVSILGTDINPRFLKKAEAGIYGRWSFRGPPDWVKAQYFRPTADGLFEIAPRVRNLVTLASVNLVEDAYPSLLTQTNAMDVIFCRNVLMYFSTAQARKVVSQLHRSLVDDGWFFPSATEASAELFDKFTPLHFERTLAYRKRAAGLLENPQPPMARPAPAEAAPVKRPTPPVAARTPELSSETMLDLARQFANAGRFDEALATCDAALAANKLAPGHHYLRGLILEESGAHDEAVAALRRALFLDHDFVLAHFALGNLLRRRSREKDAARHFENTRALLMRYDSAATLPESDGLTAGRLLAILNTTREGAR